MNVDLLEQAPPKLYSCRDTAALLGITEQTLRVMRNEHRGPEYVRFGRRIKYTAESLRDYIDSLEKGYVLPLSDPEVVYPTIAVDSLEEAQARAAKLREKDE